MKCGLLAADPPGGDEHPVPATVAYRGSMSGRRDEPVLP
jgi:hypothetical protein